MNNYVIGSHAVSACIGALVGGLLVYYYCNRPKEVMNPKNFANQDIEYEDGCEYKIIDLDATRNMVRDGYNTIAKNYSNSEKEVVSTMRPNCKENAHVISFDDFCMGDDSKEKTTLTYYTQCDTLVDDGEEVVDDRLSLIGNALERFGEMSGDPEIVYVRNEKLGTDFEIVRDNSVYNTDIGGDE